MWKRIRIGFLLIILVGVALDAWRGHAQATAWRDTLHVAVYPINADGDPATAAYIASLNGESFEEIDTFFAEQAQRYGVTTLRPVRVSVQAPLPESPPPQPVGGSVLQAMVWSLKLRWWAWRQPKANPPATVKLFVRYTQGKGGSGLDSVGLREGRIGVINVFAQAGASRSNAVVIVHELLHTLGAVDKYDAATLAPLYPAGYADPDAEPRLPQQACEIMAGRIPLEEDRFVQPASLASCVIGRFTALEIGLAGAR